MFISTCQYMLKSTHLERESRLSHFLSLFNFPIHWNFPKQCDIDYRATTQLMVTSIISRPNKFNFKQVHASDQNNNSLKTRHCNPSKPKCSASKNSISSLVSLLTHLLHVQKKDINTVTLGFKTPELPISSWQQPYLSFASIHNFHHRLAFEWYSYAELDIKITHIRNKELYINHKSSIIYCENVVKQNSILGPKVSIIHNYFTDTPNSLSQADNFSSSKLKATKKDTNFNFLFFSFIFLATKHRQKQNTHKKINETH